MTKSRPKEHIQRHRDGSLWARGQTLDGVAAGYWEWFRKDGVRMRSGHFEGGVQVGEWTTYDKTGAVYKVTDMSKKTAKNKPVTRIPDGP
jgi:antitoxin component YwqK of YwqJK toxin-antitoxin module